MKYKTYLRFLDLFTFPVVFPSAIVLGFVYNGDPFYTQLLIVGYLYILNLVPSILKMVYYTFERDDSATQPSTNQTTEAENTSDDIERQPLGAQHEDAKNASVVEARKPRRVRFQDDINTSDDKTNNNNCFVRFLNISKTSFQKIFLTDKSHDYISVLLLLMIYMCMTLCFFHIIFNVIAAHLFSLDGYIMKIIEVGASIFFFTLSFPFEFSFSKRKRTKLSIFFDRLIAPVSITSVLVIFITLLSTTSTPEETKLITPENKHPLSHILYPFFFSHLYQLAFEPITTRLRICKDLKKFSTWGKLGLVHLYSFVNAIYTAFIVYLMGIVISREEDFQKGLTNIFSEKTTLPLYVEVSLVVLLVISVLSHFFSLGAAVEVYAVTLPSKKLFYTIVLLGLGVITTVYLCSTIAFYIIGTILCIVLTLINVLVCFKKSPEIKSLRSDACFYSFIIPFIIISVSGVLFYVITDTENVLSIFRGSTSLPEFMTNTTDTTNTTSTPQ